MRYAFPTDPMTPDDIGKWLKVIRTNARLSQTQLANQLDIDRDKVSNWETGKYIPRGDNLIAFLRACGVQLDDGPALPTEGRPSMIEAVEEAIRAAQQDPEGEEDLAVLAAALKRHSALMALLAERLVDAESRRSQPQ